MSMPIVTQPGLRFFQTVTGFRKSVHSMPNLARIGTDKTPSIDTIDKSYEMCGMLLLNKFEHQFCTVVACFNKVS